MSQRHHTLLMPVTVPELAAHSRAERQRVRVQLAKLAVAPDEYDEPGVAYRLPSRYDPDIAVRHHSRANTPHWKQPFWKRRTAQRRARIEQELTLRSA